MNFFKNHTFLNSWNPLGKKLVLLVIVKIIVLSVFVKFSPAKKVRVTPQIAAQKMLSH